MIKLSNATVIPLLQSLLDLLSGFTCSCKYIFLCYTGFKQDCHMLQFQCTKVRILSVLFSLEVQHMGKANINTRPLAPIQNHPFGAEGGLWLSFGKINFNVKIYFIRCVSNFVRIISFLYPPPNIVQSLPIIYPYKWQVNQFNINQFYAKILVKHKKPYILN